MSVGPSIAISGWASASEPLNRVDIYVDGDKAASTMPSLPRPDVDQAHPGGVIKDKGWQTTLNVSGVPPGPHTIEAHAQLANGCETILGAVTVQKQP